ncbi:MAG: bifunctional homocysteine S-methyltransferase/methylenetetrahydrofolate reductase [Anaerolineales bacterium]|nr:bifunctional homocysteine S-methyltransferase/methylenetetrahydrofolate reductase [Anaerolineales bacterium]
MTTRFFDFLARGPLLADGAMGTMLHARGVSFETCFDELNLKQPAMVAEIHRAYIEAGARMIVTNTFGANRFKLERHGLAQRVGEINAAAVSLAQRVVAASFKDVLIAGDVGPLGVRLAPYGRVRPEQAGAAFREQIEALVESGVDALLIETMTDLNEIAEAVRAAKAVTDLPVIATMTFTRDDRTLLGDSPARVAARLAELGVDVLGVNCSGGPAQALRIISQMKQAAPQARLAVKPNAGWPEQVEGRIMYPAGPSYFGEYALAFAELGVSVMGGCCGTTPGHIAAMRAALDQPRPATLPRVFAVSAERDDFAEEQVGATQLAQKLAAGKFVVTVEMDPPKGVDTHRLLAGARLLAEAGADAIDVADTPMARMRMSAWAVAHLIQQEIKLETVLHFPTRGRNLLRVQGDLLAAHALGLRNIFAAMGDPTAIGDYPTANDQYDLVPSGLIKLIKQGFNAGVDHAGNKIGTPTAFFVGCALNLGAADVDKEIKNLRKKVEAGADFALTQPVYDVAVARDFLRRYEDLYGMLDLPILVGVLPLYGVRHATFLHNEVPGITIPELLLERIRRAGEAAPQEGVRIASELLDELMTIPAIRGAYLMPQFNRYDLAAEIVDHVRVRV